SLAENSAFHSEARSCWQRLHTLLSAENSPQLLEIEPAPGVRLGLLTLPGSDMESVPTVQDDARTVTLVLCGAACDERWRSGRARAEALLSAFLLGEWPAAVTSLNGNWTLLVVDGRGQLPVLHVINDRFGFYPNWYVGSEAGEWFFSSLPEWLV